MRSKFFLQFVEKMEKLRLSLSKQHDKMLKIKSEMLKIRKNVCSRTGFAIVFIETLGWARTSMFAFHSFVDTEIVPLVTAFGLIPCKFLVYFINCFRTSQFYSKFRGTPQLLCCVTDHVICFPLPPRTFFPSDSAMAKWLRAFALEAGRLGSILSRVKPKTSNLASAVTPAKRSAIKCSAEDEMNRE